VNVSWMCRECEDCVLDSKRECEDCVLDQNVKTCHIDRTHSRECKCVLDKNVKVWDEKYDNVCNERHVLNVWDGKLISITPKYDMNVWDEKYDYVSSHTCMCGMGWKI